MLSVTFVSSKIIDKMSTTSKDDGTPSLQQRMTIRAKETGQSVAKAMEPFICGGAAATFASCVIHPIDLASKCL